MDIVLKNELTALEQRQIKELEKLCHEKDGLENQLFLSTEINFDRRIPVFFLAYEGQELIGFLTLFIPTQHEAELTAVVHPLHRRKGVYRRLHGEALKVIEKYGISAVIYCVEDKSESGKAVLSRMGNTRLLRSEYRMITEQPGTLSRDEAQTETPGFCVKRVTADNSADFLKLSTGIYTDKGSDYADTVMNSESRKGYVFYKETQPIGIFVIGLEEKDHPFIYGVAISPEYRGKGYGKYLMRQALNISAQFGVTLQLDVDSDNPAAFCLYRNMGFDILFRVDYYIRNDD